MNFKHVLTTTIVIAIIGIACSSVSFAATTVKMNHDTVIMPKKEAVKLKLIGAKAKSVKWKSNKKSVVVINQKGKITSKKCGKAIIVAKYKGKKYKCVVKVKSKKYINNYLGKTQGWITEKTWNNGFCTISWYIDEGTDPFGSTDVDISKVYSQLRTALKVKKKWNKKVRNVQGKSYIKYKKKWKLAYKQMLKLEKCLDAGIPKAKSNYYLPTDKFRDYVWDLSGIVFSWS